MNKVQKLRKMDSIARAAIKAVSEMGMITTMKGVKSKARELNHLLPRQIACLICREEIPDVSVVFLGKWMNRDHSSISHYNVYASAAVASNPLYGNAYHRTRVLLGMDPFKHKKPNMGIPTVGRSNKTEWCSRPFRLTKRMRDIIDVKYMIPRDWLDNKGIPKELTDPPQVIQQEQPSPTKESKPIKTYEWTKEQLVELRKWRNTPCRYGNDRNEGNGFAPKDGVYKKPNFITGWK